jgi:methylated-DNA-[protein]-cysteine S-methyltransferase
MKTYLLETRWGWIGLVFTPVGLYSLILPQISTEAVLQQLPQRMAVSLACGDSRFFYYAGLLHRYFGGERVGLHFPIDWSGYTDFQRQVLTVVRTIPFGETRSYQWVAFSLHQAGAARAVGQAVAANRTPLVIPCHRVIRSNGELGGFRSGTAYKQKLLTFEKCRV